MISFLDCIIKSRVRKLKFYTVRERIRYLLLFLISMESPSFNRYHSLNLCLRKKEFEITRSSWMIRKLMMMMMMMMMTMIMMIMMMIMMIKIACKIRIKLDIKTILKPCKKTWLRTNSYQKLKSTAI